MNIIRRFFRGLALGLTTFPVCGDDCDCREHYLEDLGCQDWVALDTPGELFVAEEEL